MKIGKYEVIEINKNTWRIEGDIVRAFLFAGRERALLVDSTTGGGNLREVVSGLTPLPVMLVNTHADDDHIGCNGQFERAYMHPAEYAYYAEMKKPGFAEPAPLWEGEVIDLGGRSFEVILLPGHTYGSIALLDRENRVLVCGDCVSTTPVFIFGRMRSLSAFTESLKRLEERAGDFELIYPSHGEFPLGREQIDSELRCAARLAAGELEPMEPPFPVPAKMYCSDGAAFLYNG